MVECVTGDSSRREEDIPEGVEEDEDDFVIEIPLIAAAFPGYGLIGLSTGIRRGKLQQHRSHIHVNVNTSICVCVCMYVHNHVYKSIIKVNTGLNNLPTIITHAK